MNTREVYNSLAQDYDEKYVDGDDNHYRRDEILAAKHYRKFVLDNNISSNAGIISLGCGTGQDIVIIGYPSTEVFRGFDISDKMLEKARKKFPRYKFSHRDCSHYFAGRCDILVSMFGTPNYVGIHTLLAHYTVFKAKHAFFIFYADTYVDGVVDSYYKYSFEELKEKFGVDPVPLEEGSNYYVVSW